MSKRLKGDDLEGYLAQHSRGEPSPREHSPSEQLPPHAPPHTQHTSYGPSVRTTDTVARAKVEQEALMTGVLAVLICWIPFATILTLVAGAGRWSTARSWGGNAGAFATVFSAVAIVAWVLVFAIGF